MKFTLHYTDKRHRYHAWFGAYISFSKYMGIDAGPLSFCQTTDWFTEKYGPSCEVRQWFEMKEWQEAYSKIISATNNFFSEDSFSEFCEGLILQFCASYELAPEDIICFRSGNLPKQSDTKIRICAAAGEYARYISQPVKTLNEKELATKVDEVLRKKHTIHHSTTTLLFAGDNNFELVMFVNKKIEHDSTILQD